MKIIKRLICSILLICFTLSTLCSCFHPEHEDLKKLIKENGEYNEKNESYTLQLSEDTTLRCDEGLDGITLKVEFDFSALGYGSYSFYAHLYDSDRDNLSWSLYYHHKSNSYDARGKLNASDITKGTNSLLVHDLEINYKPSDNYSIKRELAEFAASALIVGLEDLSDYLEKNSDYSLADYGFENF